MQARATWTGIDVSPLGLGTWALGGPFAAGDQPLGWGQTDDDESMRVLHAALGADITLFDTADAYGTGHAERLLGATVKGRRDDVVLVTKRGNVLDEEDRQLAGVDASPACVRRALDGLVGQGKIRAYGWSSDDVERVASWAGRPGCAATEFEFNVLNDAPALVVMCEAEGLLGLCRGPPAMGLLGGALRRRHAGRRPRRPRPADAGLDAMVPRWAPAAR